MCILYQPPRSPSLKIAPTPPTLQPLSFTSEPIIDLNDLMSSAARPAVTSIPPELAGRTQHASQQRTHHAQSDCGHYGSPQLKRSHSLLRNFSLRSRNGFSLRTRVHCLPTPSLSAPKPGSVRTDSASASTASSLLSVWKKWRVKSVTNLSTLDGQDGELDAISAHHHAMCCPQGPARKRTLFSPVSRLIAPFRIPSSPPSDDEPCVIIPQSPSIPLSQQESVRLSNLDAIQDEDDNKVNGDSNAGGIVELIRQIDGRVPVESQTYCKTDPELKSTVPDKAPPLPSSRSPPPLTPSSLPPLTPSSLNSDPSSSPPLLTPSSSLSSPPFPLLPSSSPPTNSSASPPLPALQPISLPPSSPSPNVNFGLPPSSIPDSNSQSSSNPDLKPSISQKRRAKFILGDGSDLDYDSLAVPVSGPLAVARALSLNVGTEAEPVILPNGSTQPIAMHPPTPTRHDRFVHESRDQFVTTSTSSAGTATASTTNGKTTRRWTLSSALTDEDISDEGLVKELEKMRGILEWDCTPIDKDGHDLPSSSPPPSPSNPSNPWLITQRALLTTRELILTERHYLSSLLLLLCPDSTLTPVPDMMVSQARELVDISKRLLKGMEEEPSVRGVAEVFVEVGGGLGVDGTESAFVGWCGVVGGWFQDDLADTQAVVHVKRKRKGCENGVGGGGSGEYHLMIPEHEGSGPGGLTFPTSTTTGEHTYTNPLMRTVSTWRKKSMPSVTGLGEGGVWRRDRDRDRDKDEGGSTYGRGKIAFDEVRSSSSMSMTLTSIGKPIRKPAVRDLAILPTQRVTRYVLLYRDLLANTPTSSSSYPIVERAVEVACRIAEKCNRAQGNAAFVADGSTRESNSSSGSSTSMLNRNSSSSGRRRLFSGKRVMTMPEPNNLKPKSDQGSYMQSSSTTSSPTKPHFILSSSLVSTSPSTSSPPPSTPSSLSRPVSPTKNRLATNPFLPQPPPSSFNSKIPITRSHQSFGSSNFAGSSITTTTDGTFSSPSSSSSSSSFPSLSTPPPLPLFLPKTTSSSSNFSSLMPKPLSLMTHGNGLGRSVSGHAADGTGGTDSVTAPTKGYASVIPTKIKV